MILFCHSTPLPTHMALYRLPGGGKWSYQLGKLKNSRRVVCYDIALLPGRKPREEGAEFMGLGRRINVIHWDS